MKTKNSLGLGSGFARSRAPLSSREAPLTPPDLSAFFCHVRFSLFDLYVRLPVAHWRS